MRFEYKVVPAPTRGKKAKGAKTAADRFAHALGEVMNALAADGWDYLRTDTLPSQERQGLTGRTTVFQNMLVFRRAIDADAIDAAPAEDAPNIFTDEIAETHAPKLPSADAAQNMPEAPTKAPAIAAEKRGVAAE
jgi:hypothetical protein